MSDNALQSLYQEIILDHARKPHGFGLREGSTSESHQINPTCGDEVTVRLHADEAGARIESISWEGHGCAISQSSASVLSDLVHDLGPEDLTERIEAFREMMRSKGSLEHGEEILGDAEVFVGVSRYVARIKCAMLPWVAVEDALTRFQPTG
jgi:nitrogen fixation protein NifU and related proteins